MTARENAVVSKSFLTSMKEVTFIALGFLIILAGIAGLVLPVVPGAVILVAGILFLAPYFRWAQLLVQVLRQRFPRLKRVLRSPSSDV